MNDKTRARRASFPWHDDRPPHLPCRRGDLPAAVLFPGDPGRVDRFSHHMSDFRILGQNREFRIGVGSFQGLPMGVCSTGIGGPSTEIALVEAAELGCRYALRIGGTGALNTNIALGSLLVVEEALRGGGAAALYADPIDPAKAHPALIDALIQALEESACCFQKAKVCSVDGYYAGQGRPYPNAKEDPGAILETYAAAGVDALDMESETVLAVGAKLGMYAGSLLAVHANRADDTWLEDFEPAQDLMIDIAARALRSLAMMGAAEMKTGAE